MTDREKLFLYHGILLGGTGHDFDPSGPVKAWLCEEVGARDREASEAVKKEIQEDVIRAYYTARGENN